MLTIVQRGGATREKPPEVVRGLSSRLPWVWDDLCFAVPFNDATRDSGRDLVANAAPVTATGLVWTRDNRGNVAATLDNSSYLEYPYNPQHNQPSTAITVYARFKRSGTGDNAGALVAKKISTSAPWVTWNIQAADGAPDYLTGYLSINSSTTVEFTMTYSLNTTDWYSAFVRWTTGSAPTIHLLNERGGILYSAVYGSTVSGSLTYAIGQPIYINANETTTGNYYADYSQVMVWARTLTDTEIQALVADPYGWYSPRRETIGISSPYPLAFNAGEMKGGLH